MKRGAAEKLRQLFSHKPALKKSCVPISSLNSGGTNSGFLAALYQDALGRSIDSAGAAAWGALLSQGANRPQVAADILSSTEYDRHLVAGFYNSYLNRAADAGGMSWVNALLHGARDESVVAAIMASAEFFQ